MLFKAGKILNPTTLSGGFEAMRILGPLLLNIKGGKEVTAGPFASSEDGMDVEKEEILERAEWLCSKLIDTPERVLHTYPKILGDYYGPQWSIYAVIMTVAALSNIARIWPEQKTLALERMEKLLDVAMSEELRRYDTRAWREDALATLDGNNDHMTYLSLLAWAIGKYRLAGGDGRHDALFIRICETLERRMLRRKDYNLRSFPRTALFSADMVVTLVAFRSYNEVFHTNRFDNAIQLWLDRSRDVWINARNGLIVSTLKNGRQGPIRGCYTASNCQWLTLVDHEYAAEQYRLMKKHLLKADGRLVGVKEYLNKSPKLSFDPDAGPIVEGLSPSGTAFAIGAATGLGDWEFRNAMLTTAARAGGDVRKNGKRHYRLGEFSICGEATVLAMRTNLPSLTAKQ